QLPAKPRKFDEIAEPRSIEDLRTMVSEMPVELAFVGPKGVEVEGLAPRAIGGGASAFQVRGRRLCLAVPSLVVHGPEHGAPARTIAGYALLIAGVHVATAWRGEPLKIGAGAKYELKDDVVFG